MLANKVVIITGASSGLGRQLAIDLAKAGARLALFARNQQNLTETADLCRQVGAEVITVVGDVISSTDCQTLITTSVSHYGCIDILINNAGVSMWQRFAEIEDIQFAEKIMQVNYLGAVYCTHFALPYLRSNHGKIVAIASVQGFIAVPNHTAYAASKHAMVGFFNTLRSEEPELSVLVVAPSWIKNTNLRQNALGIQHKHVSTSSHAIDVQKCSQKIVKTIDTDKQQIIMPWYLHGLVKLQTFCPSLVDKIIRKAINKEG